MNYDELRPNTKRLLARFFDVSDDGLAATRRVKPQSIESAVAWCRAERNRIKQRAYLARKRSRA